MDETKTIQETRYRIHYVKYSTEKGYDRNLWDDKNMALRFADYLSVVYAPTKFFVLSEVVKVAI